MAEIRLQGARVGALVGKLKAAGVPEHVRVRLEAELGRDAQPGHHFAPRLSEDIADAPFEFNFAMAPPSLVSLNVARLL